MCSKIFPDPEKINPLPNFKNLIYIRPTITRKNIIVGDFTYFGDPDFEAHVNHHYDFLGDRLIIGKFCQIAAGVNFIMNGANHQMNCASTFPFYIFEGWKEYADAPNNSDMPFKGDTIVGNDVWIGQNATIMPGVHIGDGAIIGLNSTVGNDIEPYTISVGNPARVTRKRFDDELISLMLELKWWDKNINEIIKLIPVPTCNNLDKVKQDIKNFLSLCK